MRGWVATVCVGMTGVLAGVAQAQAPRYEVRIFERTDQCKDAYVVSVDEHGQGTGGLCLYNPDGVLMAPDARFQYAFGGAIANGAVVGVAYDDEAFYRPVIWRKGQIQAEFLPLPPTFNVGHALLINRRGDVMGEIAGNNQGTKIGFWPSDGPPVEMTMNPRGSTRLFFELSNQRQVVGCANFSGIFGGSTVPFVLKDGQTKILDPSSWERPYGCAYAINDASVVAGQSDQRPVLWQASGALKRLAPAGLQGAAMDINNGGKVLGSLNRRWIYSDGTNVWDLLGLVDDPSALTTDLNLLTIDDQGRISGNRYQVGSTPIGGMVMLQPKAPPSGSDPVPPTVSITSPWNGEPLVDLVTLKASASDNVGVAGVQFFSNGKPVGPEDTSAPYTAEADAIDMGAVPFYARARDTAGNLTSTPVRFATVTRDCRGPSAGQTLNGSIGTQTGQFTIRFTASTNQVTESGFALANGTPGGFSGTSAAVLFAADGDIKVRNGSVYVSSGIKYRIDVYHHFRMVVDVPTNRYSVWLKFANQPEKVIAAGYAFRGSWVTQLDHWIVRTDEASPGQHGYGVCNIRVP